MYDSGKIITGLIIFVGLMTFPIWSSGLKATPVPSPKKPAQAKECVQETHFMRTSHMQLLNRWRDQALREGNRETTNHKGEKVYISLQNTCMKCHSNKKEFCDKCHSYAGVEPYCWDCHTEPKGNES